MKGIVTLLGDFYQPEEWIKASLNQALALHNENGKVQLLPFQAVPLTHGFAENSRGIGAADMAYAILNNRLHRANGELAYHVLEAMHAFHNSSDEGRHYEMTCSCESPAPFPVGLTKNTLELLNQ